MSGLEEIFNPGAEETIDYLAREKVLPAPAPVAGAPIRDADGAELYIPPLPTEAVMPEPPRRPEHRPDAEGTRTDDDGPSAT
ncbi:hypothetical protein [Demequina flava]|uniref:hypothetical protein n=1 Tax=Demequina flava TaxID=1095025 RepID=UPI000781B6AD|nr:hypothetical protein [Demequina flava]